MCAIVTGDPEEDPNHEQCTQRQIYCCMKYNAKVSYLLN